MSDLEMKNKIVLQSKMNKAILIQVLLLFSFNLALADNSTTVTGSIEDHLFELKYPASVFSPNSTARFREPSLPTALPEPTASGNCSILSTPQMSEYVYLGDWYDWHYYAIYMRSGETDSIKVDIDAPDCWDGFGEECSNLLDLYMKDDGVPTEADYDVKSTLTGDTESATDTYVNSVWYYIGVKRLEDKYGWYTIKVTTASGEKYTDEVFSFLNSDILNQHFTTSVPSGMPFITGETDGISGVDLLDLYMRDDDLASSSNYDAFSATTSEDEFARDYNPDSGWYYASAEHYSGEGYFSFWFNLPPNKPDTPDGPGIGYVDEDQTFSTSATEPDGDSLKYCFDWGDSTSNTCTGYVPSGTTKSESHSYSTPDTYCVKAQAKDSPDGEESDWSACKYILIKSKTTPTTTTSTTTTLPSTTTTTTVPTTTSTTVPTTTTTTTTTVPPTTSSTTTTLPNNPPVANAGPDFWVTQGEAFSLDGSASTDPDGDPLSYSWSDEYGEFTGETGVNPTVTLNIVDHGSKKVHNITLTVSDGRGDEDIDTVEVTVIPKWVPTDWNEITTLPSEPGEVRLRHLFKWNQDHLDHLKSGGVDYQWELRRDSDVWDWWQADPDNPGKCIEGYAYHSFNADYTYEFSEESNELGEDCDYDVDDEEFQLKVFDVDNFDPNTFYEVKVGFTKKLDVVPTFWAESEYCGPGIACGWLPYNPDPVWYRPAPYFGYFKFDYYMMEEKSELP